MDCRWRNTGAFDGAINGLQVFEVEGEYVVMLTQGLAAVPCQLLKRPIGSFAEKRAEIVSALDLLFQGF